MFDQIKECQKCGLCFNQKPLLDKEQESEVFWVGLSAKKVHDETETPLCPTTNSGMLIQKIEGLLQDIPTYKTNLVKCLPLNKEQKLRYPNKTEIDRCFDNLQKEIQELSPKIVFLLGIKVYSAVEKHLQVKFTKWDDFNYHYTKYDGIFYVPIHHPSYIYVYKRKQIEQYVSSIGKLTDTLLCIN